MRTRKLREDGQFLQSRVGQLSVFQKPYASVMDFTISIPEQRRPGWVIQSNDAREKSPLWGAFVTCLRSHGCLMKEAHSEPGFCLPGLLPSCSFPMLRSW